VHHRVEKKQYVQVPETRNSSAMMRVFNHLLLAFPPDAPQVQSSADVSAGHGITSRI